MAKVKVGVAGYGTIGTRLADGVVLQEDMELVGIVGHSPSLAIRALAENNMIGVNGVEYKLYLVDMELKPKFDALGIPVEGSFEELCAKVDVMLDASPGGTGAANKAVYERTSCNTTGLIRAVDCLDRKFGIEKVAITIIRRVADPGDYHRGLTNALQMEKAPSHQAVDLMTIMPHIEATGILVHTPVTHGHIITVLATAKDGRKITREEAIQAFRSHPRIRTVTIEEGFKGNASFFKYARDLGNRRADLYEIGLWEDSVVESGNDIMFAIHIPQESVTIPETIDGVRAVMQMQQTSAEATEATNRNLNIGRFKR